MLVSYQWLNDYLDLCDISPEVLAEKLTRAGVEVETVQPRNKGIQGVVVGHVLERKQHPNADKLSVCQVDLGEAEPAQIVCGAPNVAAGQKVVVAKVGAVLPGNFKIKKAKLRGEASNGMICSLQELGIEDRLVAAEFKQGIVVLPNEVEVGSDALALLGLDDTILELSLTPNRSDCLSMLGVAYEVAAILGKEVRFPNEQIKESPEVASDYVKVQIDAGDLCSHYAAKVIKGVRIAPSPLWMQNRLIAAGIRPISNVVDVTNFVMLEYGQPLHAFDAQEVQNGQIIVRRAKSGELVVTLDDQERQLSEDMLVITDPEKVIAVAGVMGAANSEVRAETTDIILEAAHFAGSSVRATSKALGLRSEASMRFEKGVDPERVLAAANRAAYLLAEVAGGEVLQGVAEQEVGEVKRQEVTVTLVKINKVLGTKLSLAEVTAIFDRLGFDYENKGHEIRVEIPTRRPDIHIEEDLLEEVARLYGYDNIPTTLPTGNITPGTRNQRQEARLAIKRFLQGAGLSQVITYSLTSLSNANLGSVFMEDAVPIGLKMPMSEERSHLRTTVIPNLLEVAAYNRNRKMNDLHLFEIGHVFLTKEKALTTLPQEKEVVAGMITGLWRNHPWQQEKVEVDFFVLKGIVEGLLAKLAIKDVQYSKAELDGFHPGRTAWITVGEQRLGYLGQIHPEKQEELDLAPVYVFELDLDQLEELLPGEILFSSLPKYPSIQRDLAVVVEQSVEAGNLLQTIKEVGQPLLQSVSLFDVYSGDRLEAGKKSVAFSLTYLDPEKTLTDEDVQEVHDQVVEALANKWSATLRK